MTNPTSNEQGPLWTPTVTVERLLRQARLSIADQITMDRKQLEGLLFDVLRCRSEHLIPSAASETTAPPDGDWLWRHLMDWCKGRGVKPADYNDLFLIVKLARSVQKSPPEATAGCPICGGGVRYEHEPTCSSQVKSEAPQSDKCEHGLPRRFCTAVHEGDTT